MADAAFSQPVISARAAEAKLLGFLQALRGAGYSIGIGESRDALSLVVSEPMQDRRLFQSSLRHLLCSSREEWLGFDAHFLHHYGTVGEGGENEPGSETGEDDDGQTYSPEFQIVADFYHNADGGTEGGAGRNAAVTRTDFRFLTDEEGWEEAARLTENLARRIVKRPTRRWRKTRAGKRIDLATTARYLPATDGDPLRIGRRERKRRPMHVVALLDVSHSMSYYSPMLARFVRGLVHNFKGCEAFCFHMELNRITDHMKEAELEVMREKMEALENLWFGGTNISASIQSFNERFLRQTVRRDSVVLLMTDGCDTSPVEELRRPIADLKSAVRKLYWVNPLKARLNEAGLASASPLSELRCSIDAEVSGDSFRSLEKLARVLST